MIPVIILLAFSFFLFRSYAKGVICITIFSAFIDAFSISGMSIYSYLSLLAILLLPYKIKNANIKSYPFLIPSIFIFLSLLFTEIITSGGHFPSVVMLSANYVIFPFIIWNLFKNSGSVSLKYFLKVSFAFAALIAIYSFFEYTSISNPFVDAMSRLDLYPYSYDLQIRYGLKRTYTFFPMHITNGAVSIGLFLILLYAKLNKMLKTKIVYIVLILLVINIFATGSRAVILSFIIFLLFFLSLYFKLSTLLKITVSILLAYFVLGTYINTIIDSFIDTESVIGSNADMREGQFELAFYFLNKSFWFGNGIGEIGNVLINYQEMMGAESLWIPVMVEQGIFGIISIISIFVFSIVYAYKRHFIPMIWIPIGFIVLFTMTSIPNCQPTYHLPIMFTIMAIYIQAQTKKRIQ